jgi:D-allose transport system substrate-binding protein
MNIDEKIDMTELKNAGGNVLAFATTDNVVVGENGAGYIVENLEAGDQVAIVEGKAGNASGEARRQGAENAFTAAKLEIVASQPADWDRTKALDLAANLIQRYPDLKGIYCANDTMALGVQQAVVNAGLEEVIMVVGTDGAPEAIESVKNGELSATVAQDPAEIGAVSLRILVEAMNGERAQIGVDEEPELIAVGSQLITE